MIEQYEEPLVFVAERIEMIPAVEIYERKTNPKLHPPEQIARLAGNFLEMGFLIPLLIDSKNNLIAGHGRKLGGEKIGMSQFPCIRADHLTPAQISAFVLFDNKIAETGYDPALLKINFEDLSDIDDEMLGLTGFSDKEINDILNDIESCGDDGEEATPKPPTLTFGDHKIQMTLAEETALDQLAEMHLSKNKDLVGFVEKTLLKNHY